MLSYETAKKLKEAGFPTIQMTDDEMSHYQQVEIFDGVCYHIPTLEELIEACNPLASDDFSLEIDGNEWKVNFLYVGYFDCWKGIKPNEDGLYNINIEVKDSSRKEAVANLWLKLNGRTQT